MPDQSLWGVLLSCAFLIAGIVAMAAFLYRDQLKSWWSEVTR